MSNLAAKLERLEWLESFKDKAIESYRAVKSALNCEIIEHEETKRLLNEEKEKTAKLEEEIKDLKAQLAELKRSRSVEEGLLKDALQVLDNATSKVAYAPKRAEEKRMLKEFEKDSHLRRRCDEALRAYKDLL